MGLEGGVGSLAGNDGEIIGCCHGGRGLNEGPCTTTATVTSQSKYTINDGVVIGGRLMSAGVERSTAFVGSQ